MQSDDETGKSKGSGAVLCGCMVAAQTSQRRLQHLGHAIFCPRHLGRDASVTARKCAYTFFILLCILMILSTALLTVFSVPERVVRMILYAEIALAFPCSMVRTAQFLNGQCSKLATFLYLCGLEILPAAVLLLSTLI